MLERKLYLEENLPTLRLVPVEFEDARKVIRYGDFYIRYVGFNTRFDPHFAILYNANKRSLSLNDELYDRIIYNTQQVIESQEKIKRLGIPKQQVHMRQNGQYIVVSNYLDKVISKEHLEEISLWFSTMNSLSRDRFENFTNIFIIPDSGKKLETGENVNGSYRFGLSGTILYPPAFEKREHRTGKISNLTGTLTHEYFHQYNHLAAATRLCQEWMELGGWMFNFQFPIKIAGRTELSRLPQFIETDYDVSSAEEFCDAGVKAIYNRQGFKDKKKLDFFDQNFIDFTGGLVPRKVDMAIVREPTIPSLPNEFTYSIMSLQ